MCYIFEKQRVQWYQIWNFYHDNAEKVKDDKVDKDDKDNKDDKVDTLDTLVTLDILDTLPHFFKLVHTFSNLSTLFQTFPHFFKLWMDTLDT